MIRLAMSLFPPQLSMIEFMPPMIRVSTPLHSPLPSMLCTIEAMFDPSTPMFRLTLTMFQSTLSMLGPPVTMIDVSAAMFHPTGSLFDLTSSLQPPLTPMFALRRKMFPPETVLCAFNFFLRNPNSIVRLFDPPCAPSDPLYAALFLLCETLSRSAEVKRRWRRPQRGISLLERSRARWPDPDT